MNQVLRRAASRLGPRPSPRSIRCQSWEACFGKTGYPGSFGGIARVRWSLGVDTGVCTRGLKTTTPSARLSSAGEPDSCSTTISGGTGDTTQEGDGVDDEDMFQDPKASILEASLAHVASHGFTDVALAAGARDCGFHGVTAGMFLRGPIELVEHFMAKALEEVKALEGRGESTGSGEFGEGSDMSVRALREGMKVRLMALSPYIQHWPQAMSLGVQPQNMSNTVKALALLVDELAFLSGDRSIDMEWYSKRAIIAATYTSTELFMITDTSEGFQDTWEFLDRRLEDFDTLATAPVNVGDILSGMNTAATSLGSAVVSLAGPFLKQATKQVPGGQAISDAVPMATVLMSSVLSFLSSCVTEKGVARGMDNVGTPSFKAAPEADPLVGGGEKSGKGSLSRLTEELAKDEAIFEPSDIQTKDKTTLPPPPPPAPGT